MEGEKLWIGILKINLGNKSLTSLEGQSTLPKGSHRYNIMSNKHLVDIGQSCVLGCKQWEEDKIMG